MSTTKDTTKNVNTNVKTVSKSYSVKLKNMSDATTYVLATYKNVTSFKKAKKTLKTKFSLTDNDIQTLKKKLNEVLIKTVVAYSKTTLNSLTYDDFLKFAYEKVSTKKEFKLIAQTAGIQSVTDLENFILEYYSSIIDNKIACKMSYLDTTNMNKVTRYEIREADKFTPAFAISVIKTCIRNYTKVAKNVINDKTVKSNKFKKDEIFKVEKVTRIKKYPFFELKKLDMKNVKIDADTLKPFSSFVEEIRANNL